MFKNYKVGNFYLDDNQMQLIKNDENTLIIAGAGSGKSLTLIGKINYLIENKICDPENILVISFTNASVNDLKEKIAYKLDILTFHKLSINILKDVNFTYKLCSDNFLSYIIKEKLYTLSTKNKKTILKYLKINSTYQNFIESKQFISLINNIESFINSFKTNNINRSHLTNIKLSNLEKNFLIIILNIYQTYIQEKKSLSLLDFDDLIIYATHYVSKANLKYKYIIIDEFQDTSLIRLNLIKEIYYLGNTKIIVVGDDWQSIYRFSGCDLNIFLNFSSIFPNVKTLKLSNTYRNSRQLIEVASKFVQKNPKQIKKKLYSEIININPIIFVPYTNKIYCFKKLLNYLLNISDNIIILSRNNNDIYSYLDNDIKFTNNLIYYKNKELKFYTIHKSKG